MANQPREQQQKPAASKADKHPYAPDADDDQGPPPAGSAPAGASRSAQKNGNGATPGTELAVLERARIEYTPALKQAYGIEPGQWKVLTDAIFPGAKTADAVLMALAYCKARHLDIFKKPVHIVPMWSAKGGPDGRGGYIETVWPSIGEIQTTASRTGQWAGMDKPVFTDDITRTFEGRVKKWTNGVAGWENQKFEVTFPESCTITVYRIVHGVRCPFTEEVFWLESYGRVGGTDLPNEMWQKRVRGQLVKCTKAAVLRTAFPECDFGPTAEEMEGKVTDALAVTVATHDAKPDDVPAERPRRENYTDAEVVETVVDSAAAAAATGPVHTAEEATVGTTPGKAEAVPEPVTQEPENINSETILFEMTDRLSEAQNVEALNDVIDDYMPKMRFLTPSHVTRFQTKASERRKQLTKKK